MPLPRFSEFLAQRRRQLGLSLGQASRVLRMKEQVLQAFEEGDWNRIPRSGYAQGMLSSYARYLGLNPREVIDLFQEDLADYSSGGAQSASRVDDRVPGLAPGTPHAQTRRSRPGDKDLYGSAGPAGSILTGSAFGTHSQGGSSPLVGARNAGYAPRYLGDGSSREESGGYSMGASRQRRNSREGSREKGYPQGRPYTSRDPRRQSNPARRTTAAAGRSQRASADARRIVREDITTRRVPAEAYSDDLRYDQASPYERSTSERGREALRSAQRPARPNVRRRTSNAQRQQLRNRQNPPKSGVVGVIEAWFSDQRRTILTIIVAMAIVLTLVIVFSFKACTNRPAPDNKAQIPVSTEATGTDDGSSDSATTDDATADDGATDDAAADAAAAKEEKKPEKVEVKVAVADGQVSWVEIKLDGKSEVARSITGPWEQTYNVVDTMEIRVADPAAVTVTMNGEPVQFDTKTSGIGTATIEGPGETVDNGDGTDAQSTTDDGSTSDSGDSGSNTTGTTSGSGSDSTSSANATTQANKGATSAASGTSGNGANTKSTKKTS